MKMEGRREEKKGQRKGGEGQWEGRKRQRLRNEGRSWNEREVEPTKDDKRRTMGKKKMTM